MNQNSIEELYEKYEQAQLNWHFHSFLLAAFALFGIGVSQIVYGWAGDAFVPRYLYPTFCFLMGGGIVWVWIWVVSTDGIFPVPTESEFRRQLQEEANERAFQTLAQLATGMYGEFEMNEELTEDLQFLEQRGYLRACGELAEYPDRGPELNAYFVVPDAVREYFQKCDANPSG